MNERASSDTERGQKSFNRCESRTLLQTNIGAGGTFYSILQNLIWPTTGESRLNGLNENDFNLLY